MSDDIKLNNIICDSNPDLIIHLAAESHVDRSLEEPKLLFRAIYRDLQPLQSSLKYWSNLRIQEENLLDFYISVLTKYLVL